MKKIYVLIFILLFSFSCQEKPEKSKQNQSTQENDDQKVTGNKAFWESLRSLCGQSFEGELSSAPPSDDFEGKKLLMHLLSCDEEQILVPFNVGDNRSRTWIFTYKNGLITLKHDHRQKDGTSDEVTMYGGTTSNTGIPGMAVFPADQETLNLIEYAATNVWWVTLNEKTFTYNLKRIGGEGIFTVSFDLTKPVEQPKPSWGWEDFLGNE